MQNQQITMPELQVLFSGLLILAIIAAITVLTFMHKPEDIEPLTDDERGDKV